jgi:putative ABC transport system permease protein
MSIFENLRTAIGGLTANKLRASLTMLGMIIGVAAVVTLLSVGQGVQASVTNQIEAIGSNLLTIIAYQPPGTTASAQLTDADATALANPYNAPALAAVAPAVQGRMQVSRGNLSFNLTIVGTNPAYAQVRNITLAAGGFLDANDLADQTLVAVLGWQAYLDLFPNGEYPVGQTIIVGGTYLQVVGVAESSGGIGLGGNQDESIYVPLTTAQTRFLTTRALSGQGVLSAIYVSAANPNDVTAATAEIEQTLRTAHNLTGNAADNFQIISQTQLLSTVSQTTGLLTLFLGAIAGISLLVGGIGIMNIMLVSVTERTREVGIRKAVGATRRDILVQFLLEAIVLSFLGGLVGIGMGYLGSDLISGLSTSLTTVISAWIIVLAVGVASAIGLVFGVYPAMRAARLQPIEALRYE